MRIEVDDVQKVEENGRRRKLPTNAWDVTCGLAWSLGRQPGCGHIAGCFVWRRCRERTKNSLGVGNLGDRSHLQSFKRNDSFLAKEAHFLSGTGPHLPSCFAWDLSVLSASVSPSVQGRQKRPLLHGHACC